MFRLRGLSPVLLSELGRCRAGIDAGDLDTQGRHLPPQGVGKSAHAILGGGIDGVHRCRDQTCHRGHVDDMPSAGGPAWTAGRRASIGSTPRKLTSIACQCRRRDRAFPASPGGPARHYLRGCQSAHKLSSTVWTAAVDLGLLGHIELEGKSLPAGETDLFGQRGQAVHAPGSQDDDAAFFGKQPCGVRSKARGGAGDEDDFITFSGYVDMTFLNGN